MTGPARHVAVDVETTGLNPAGGDRVISVGCVELVERQLTGRTFHRLVNPDRSIPEESSRVHGITDEQVAGKPRFADLAEEFLDFVGGAELLGHNLEFDRGFLDEELRRAGRTERLQELCGLICTFKMARARYPTQRNNLDAVSIRLGVASESRGYHDALEDARLTARVWLRMTMGQGELKMSDSAGASGPQALSRQGLKLACFEPDEDDLKRHREMLEMIDGKSEQGAVWLRDFKES